jgi:hypothetical protein
VAPQGYFVASLGHKPPLCPLPINQVNFPVTNACAYWCTEQIVGCLELDKKIKISTETAYRFCLGNRFYHSVYGISCVGGVGIALFCNPWGATLAERKSRFYLALPVTNKTAQAVNDAIAKLLTPLNLFI